ncbi:hypothetical protein MUK42_36920 [Musa troglodytarum]|uniref:Uncharacterized protein n=1 Tax=Musa troglodytarum TaxID=320322 RepID=A0A9E7KER5_9LILI|nr:hypothetical protein MUK42_36920 [Musa troglodytarum]
MFAPTNIVTPCHCLPQVLYVDKLDQGLSFLETMVSRNNVLPFSVNLLKQFAQWSWERYEVLDNVSSQLSDPFNNQNGVIWWRLASCCDYPI